MKTDSNIIDAILNGRDLHVVLENQLGDPYVESYHLTTILCLGERFWGKFANVHSSMGHNELNSFQTLSYCYNNFANVVCTSGLRDGIVRYISSHAYSGMNFITRYQFTKIWDSDSGGDISVLNHAVRTGAKLKLKIELPNLVIIAPIHTMEVSTLKKTICIETQFDGFPADLLNIEYISEVSRDFDSAIDIKRHNGYPATPYYHDKPHFLTSFLVVENILNQRKINKNGELENTMLPYEKLSVYGEAY